MSERGSLESEETIESKPLEETKESVESRALEDATYEPKARVEQTGSVEQSEAVEAAVKQLIDTSAESVRTVESPAVSEAVKTVAKELPESKRQGKQKDTNLADGSEFGGVTISGIEGLPESDPFTEGGTGPDAGEESREFGDIMPDFKETIQAAQMEREPFDPGRIGGGPGSIHPKYGPSGGGMIGDDPDSSGTTEEDKKSEHTFEADSVYKSGSKKAVAQAELAALEAAKNLENSQEAYIAGTGTQEGVIVAGEELDVANEYLDEQYQAAEDIELGFRKMPRPDGDDEGVDAPQSEDDVKHEDMVVDPASTMGTVRSSGVDHRKHRGVVSDPAEWQDPDTPDGGVKTDLDLAKDPPEEEPGKGKGKR